MVTLISQAKNALISLFHSVQEPNSIVQLERRIDTISRINIHDSPDNLACEIKHTFTGKRSAVVKERQKTHLQLLKRLPKDVNILDLTAIQNISDAGLRDITRHFDEGLLAIKIPGAVIEAETLQFIGEKFCDLRFLTLTDPLYLTGKDFYSFSNSCTTLQTLHVAPFNKDSDIFDRLIEANKNLSSFIIEGGKFHRSTLSALCQHENIKILEADCDCDAQDEDLILFIKRCSCLESLSLCGWKEISGLSLHTLADAPNLKKLRLHDDGQQFSSMDVLDFAEQTPTLEEFSLTGMVSLKDDEFKAVFDSWPALKKLRLDIPQASSEAFSEISRSCPKLQEWHLGDCPSSIEDETWLCLINGLPELKKITFSSCTIQGAFLTRLLNKNIAVDFENCRISGVKWEDFTNPDSHLKKLRFYTCTLLMTKKEELIQMSKINRNPSLSFISLFDTFPLIEEIEKSSIY